MQILGEGQIFPPHIAIVKSAFSTLLLKWNKSSNQRSMPWKGEKDAYLIWLSEIILQQTRVEQGTPYFLRFKEKYPTVKHLALASEDEVMKLWQGLGYYSRARHLHYTAQYIFNELKGKFPETYEGIRRLKGIGDYTAAAIASFAFNEDRAVVDGNVIRVLARVFGIKTPFDTTAGKKEFATKAQSLIDEQKPGLYNQSIMDFGSLVCLPKNPLCSTCVFKQTCVAFDKGSVEDLPVRSKKTKIRNRYFTYLLFKNNKQVLIQKRNEKDIWKGMYELPLIETKKVTHRKDIEKEIKRKLSLDDFRVKEGSTYTQMLSHRKIHFHFYEVETADWSSVKWKGAEKVPIRQLVNYGFPKTIHLYLSQNSLF